ncbi:MAG: PEP-CTERM sorting domain-containing protein [Myxococcota bacterium]
MKPQIALLALCSCLALATPAAGVGIAALDLDPTIAGVQDTLDVTVGKAFQLDLVLSGFTPGQIQSYQAAVAFDPLSVLGVSASGGDVLPPPVFLLDLDVQADQILIAELGLGGPGTGNGVLASFQLVATAEGASDISISQVLLSGAFGDPIAVGSLRGGSITAAIPEPGSALLFAVGATVVGRLRRR